MNTCYKGWSVFLHFASDPHKLLLQVVSMVSVAVHKQLHWLVQAQASQLLNLGGRGGRGRWKGEGEEEGDGRGEGERGQGEEDRRLKRERGDRERGKAMGKILSSHYTQYTQ